MTTSWKIKFKRTVGILIDHKENVYYIVIICM